MSGYDQAQSQRLAQRNGVEQPGIRLVYLEDLPEIAYRGQLIYNGTSDQLMVYDGDAWQTAGDNSGSRLFVQAADPLIAESVGEGDQWYSTTTGILQVFNGSAWVEPALPEDSVGTYQIIADSITANELAANSITTTELAADAITAKHSIISATYYTSLSGTRLVIQNDSSGGIIRFHYDAGEALSGFINPAMDGSRPKLHLSSGSMASGGENSAQLQLFGAFSGGSGKKAEFNCNLFVEGVAVSSSRRYKTEIEDLDYTVEQILALRPVSYRRKDSGVKSIGFIAEDAEELGMTEVVISEDGQVEAFNYPAYTAALQKVVQVQEERIRSLEERLEALEARNAVF
jgi:hypothetical protein